MQNKRKKPVEDDEEAKQLNASKKIKIEPVKIEEAVESEEEIPLAARKKPKVVKPEPEDDDEDVPLAARKQVTSQKKKKKRVDSDDEDEPVKKVKKEKPKVSVIQLLLGTPTVQIVYFAAH